MLPYDPPKSPLIRGIYILMINFNNTLLQVLIAKAIDSQPPSMNWIVFLRNSLNKISHHLPQLIRVKRFG